MMPADVLDLFAGCVLGALGLAALALRGRHLPAAGFGCFAIGLATLYVGIVLVGRGPEMPVAYILAANLVILVGFWTMIAVFPMPIQRQEWAYVAAAAGVGLVGAAIDNWGRMMQSPDYWFVRGDEHGLLVFGFRIFIEFIGNAGIIAGVIFFALRARRFPPDATAVARSLGIFATGCAFFLTHVAAGVVRVARGEIPPTSLVFILLVCVTPTLLWASVGGPHRKIARNVAVAYAVVFGVTAISATVDADLVQAIGRTAGVVMLGYAVLRGQISGLDLKIRFAISKSTVAGVFIAVFFVASEATQQFFGETLGSTYVGIATAGALVFAMAPLQRAAERLAARAVPVTPMPSGIAAPVTASVPAGADNEDLYIRAARLALRDRIVTAEEELDLIELAERLGIGARRAAELRLNARDGSKALRRKVSTVRTPAGPRPRPVRGGRDA